MTKKESIDKCLKEYGFSSLEEAISFVKSNGIDVDKEVKSIQPIAFDNAVEAYNLGVAIALKKGAKTAEEAAEYIGEGLQAFCKPGSVADERKIGLGHGKLASMLLNENTKCFCFFSRS